MAVKVVITLEGVEQVKKGLADVTQAGTRSAQAINGLNTTEVNAALQNLGIVSTNAGRGIRSLTVEAVGLRQAKLLLKPILEQVGVSVGGIAAFAGAARLGLIGLAAAAGGAVAVGLAKSSDSIEQVKRQLAAFSEGRDPQQLFDEINDSAKQLGTTFQKVAEAVLAAARAQRQLSGSSFGRTIAPPGQEVPAAFGEANAKDAIKNITALASILVKAGANSDVATEAAKKFFAALGAGGKITEEMVRDLAGVSEAGTKTFGEVITGRTVDIKRLESDIVGADKSFKQITQTLRDLKAEQANPIQIETLTQGLNALEGSFDRLAQKAGGKSLSQIIGAGLKNLGTSAEALFGGRSLSDILTQDAKDATRAFQLIIDAGRFAFDQITQIFSDNIDLSSWLASFTTFFNDIVNRARTAFQQIKAAFDQIDLSSGLGVAPGGEGVPTLAGGGHVLGPGSSTSDSIFARLSNFEYVVRAAAVRHYGVPFFNAINQMRLPKDFFRGFNLGGLVSMPRMPVPGFAGGGLATAGAGGTPFTLVIDGQRFGGLSASGDSANELIRYARMRSRASGGRAPSSVR